METPAATRLLRSLALVGACFSLSCDPSAFGTPATSGNIVVEFPGTAPAHPPLLQYSGMEGSSCVQFVPYVANPTVTLDNVSVDPSCQVEIDVFTPSLGAYARDVDLSNPSDDDWLTDAIAAGSLSIGLPELTVVPIRIWLVANPASMPTAKAARDRLLDKAYPVFETMGMGMTFDTSSATLSPVALTAHCDQAGAISMNPAIYDATKINAYFVSDYGNIPGLTPANNCWMKSHPEILFISWGNENLTDPTLSHELGHALGLVHPNAVGGHTYAVPGFHAYNLMATNTDVIDVTIGQLYALNFSSDSWINRTGSPLVRPVVRSCQDTWGAGVCPSLTLSQAGWPP